MVLVRVLGPIAARASPDDAWVEPAPQQRVVLALLAANRGSPCRRDRLVQAVWGDDAPGNAYRLLQGLVSRLRRVLGPDGARGSRVVTVQGGWRLDLDGDQLDAARFERLVHVAGGLVDRGDIPAGRARLDEAVALWRGRPFGELADHPLLAGEAARLEETHLAAREKLLELRLEAGEHAELAPELRKLARAHPLRERLQGLRMLALYRAGRQADALAVYEEVRGRLAAELGADPGPELQALHGMILRQDVSRPTRRPDRPRQQPPRTRWPCRRELPLAGRDTELARLRDMLGRARRGQRHLVLVSGEAGIGKTRLVAELADHARGSGADVLVGRCTPGARLPYQPFVEALRADVEATPDHELARRLGGHAGELARLVPELVERTGQGPRPNSSNPDVDRHRLFDAVAGWLATAARTPLVVVLEDLHAATRPTLLLLRHTAQATAGTRLLLAATYRDTTDDLPPELADILAELAHQRGVTHLPLGGLALPAVADLVAAGRAETAPAPVTGPARANAADAAAGADPAEGAGRPPDGADHRWVERLHGATAGNPLFVEELLATLPAGSASQPADPVEDVHLPWSLRQLLQGRIRRLSPALGGCWNTRPSPGKSSTSDLWPLRRPSARRPHWTSWRKRPTPAWSWPSAGRMTATPSATR